MSNVDFGLDMEEVIAPLMKQWAPIAARIEDIDSKLGDDTVGRRKLLKGEVTRIEDLVKNNNESVSQCVPQVKKFMDESLNDEQRVAVATAFLKFIGDEVLKTLPKSNRIGIVQLMTNVTREKAFQNEIDQFIKDNTPKEVPKLPDEEQLKLRLQRKELVETANLIRTLVGRQEASKLEEMEEFTQTRMPSAGGNGGAGSRGVRLKGSFNFTITDNRTGQVISAGTSLTDVGRKLNVLVNGEGNTIKTAVSQQIEGFDFKNPPDEWQFVIDNMTVRANRMVFTGTPIPESDDSDDADDDEVMTEEAIDFDKVATDLPSADLPSDDNDSVENLDDPMN